MKFLARSLTFKLVGCFSALSLLTVSAVGAIALAAVLHAVRARPGAWTQNLVVVLKLLILVGFVVLYC